MSQIFELPVTYRSEEYLFPSELMQTGYTFKISMKIRETDLLFEQDEEGNFRAMVEPALLHTAHIDQELLQIVCETLKEVFQR
jgi:hypothetical protein